MNETNLYTKDDFEKARIQDSLRIIEEKGVQNEMADLRSKGIIGKWKTSQRGFKTNIVFTKIETKYQATTNHLDGNYKPIIENLRREVNTFFVKGSDVGQFYKINKVGNLEIWDNQGLFTTGRNILPGIKKKSEPKFDIKKALGENIFTVAGMFSQSNPKTLSGTSNAYWIVYYMDLNTTFRVKKNTMEIEKAVSGQISNLN